MKHISRFLLCALSLVCANTAIAAPVATTVGSNLTAYNPTSGATNNAMWNAYMNPRANTSAPTADFGNCNAAIIRCAQPKCSNGGCATMDVARPIVVGCVETNPSCKQYGDDLIDYIAAQLVSDANAASAAAANATATAAQAAAAQSNQQLQQMQQQMQQMQQQMQQQSADTAAQIQAALEQQQAATTAAIANATASAANQSAPASAATTTAPATTSSDTTASLSAGPIDLTAAQTLAAQSGVDANLLAREQISGEILTGIENAEVALKSAKAAMETAFEYAGCDSAGNNCAGPARVRMFKQKAMEFFEPYNDVLNELYDALILAQSVGVDITDIYMMLNGTCNVWGQYLCTKGQVMHYTAANCKNGRSVAVNTGEGTVMGGAECEVGQVVPMSDGGCQLIKMLTDQEEVQRNWLYYEEGLDGAQVRVGCASEALDNSFLFRGLKRQANIDIDVLQRMIEQDAPAVYGGNRFGQNKSVDPDGLKYCAVTSDTFQDLQQYASLKQLPDKVCVPDEDLESIFRNGGRIAEGTSSTATSVFSKCASLSNGYEYEKCLCDNSPSKNAQWVPSTDENAIQGQGECKCIGSGFYSKWDSERAACVDARNYTEDDYKYLTYVDEGGFRKEFCNDYKASWNEATLTCDCSTVSSEVERKACEIMTATETSNAPVSSVSSISLPSQNYNLGISNDGPLSNLQFDLDAPAFLQ